MLNEFAIIIPYHPKETCLPKLLSSLQELAPGIEIHTIQGNNRAAQMNEGRAKTAKKYLWFLHADSVIQEESVTALEISIRQHPNALHYFNLAFEVDSPLMKINSFGANLRSHFLKMPFGDQGFCISRENFDGVGGFDISVPYG